jgi:hypothetical protein
LTLGVQDWDCAGAAGHRADLERVASSYRGPSTDIEVQRCRICGLHYQVYRTEISDWSAGRDYYDETTIWTPLDADEIEAAGTDSNFQPRHGAHHRHDTGWR